MSSYTIRVVLHDASWDNYVDLQEKLGKARVFDTILGSDGIRYNLPPAEYVTESTLSLSEIRDGVYKIAATVKANPAVFVSQSVGCGWIGLKSV